MQQQQQQSSTTTTTNSSNDYYSQLSLMCKDCVHCQYMYELIQEQQLQQQQLLQQQQQQKQRLPTVDEYGRTISPQSDTIDDDYDDNDNSPSDHSSYNDGDDNNNNNNDFDQQQQQPIIRIQNLDEKNMQKKLLLLDRSESNGSTAAIQLEAMDEFDVDEFIEPIEGLPIVTLCPPELSTINSDSGSGGGGSCIDDNSVGGDISGSSDNINDNISGNSDHNHIVDDEDDDNCSTGITVVSLEVPILGQNSSKQSRSASVDSPYLLQVPKRDDIEVGEGPPKPRSKSVDIVLPTCPGGPYLLIPPRHPPTTTKKTVQGEIKIQAENGETRVLRSAPDWTESAILGDHIWVSTSTSGSDLCYVGENKCTKIGPRLCCPACKVTAHTGCISILIDNMKFQCKPTFKDGVRQYREQTFVKHHWVHRRHEKGRCKHCGRSFQSKLSFGNKEVVAVSCSWCKSSYHNKEPCFTKNMLEDNCDFGLYRRIIVPSSWIVKLPRKGSFKSSIRRTPRNKRLSSKKRSSSKSSSTTTPTTSIATTTTPLSTNKLSSSSPIHSAQNNVINPLNSNGQTTIPSVAVNNLNVIPINAQTVVAEDFYPPPPPQTPHQTIPKPPHQQPPPSLSSLSTFSTTTTTPQSSSSSVSSLLQSCALLNQQPSLQPTIIPLSSPILNSISQSASTEASSATTTTTITNTVMSDSFLSTSSSSSSPPPPLQPPPPLPQKEPPLASSSSQLQSTKLQSINSFDNELNSINNLSSIIINNNNNDGNVVDDNNQQSSILNSDNICNNNDDLNEELPLLSSSPPLKSTAIATTPITIYTQVTNSNNSSANQNSNSNPNRIQRHRRHSHANVTSSSSSILNGSQIPGQTNLLSGHHHHHPTNSIAVVNNRVEQYLQHVHRSFVIKPIPSANLRPLLVFINPKSGGNQGSKLIQKFQWHLNPRQVFDLSQSGPRLGLDLYKKVHNLRILACGGDGTAGWILSVIDEIAIQPPPPISVLPLGTGNDLARSFGWGGSYTDEPIAKILCNIQDGQIVQLDRWNLKVQPNQSCQQQQSQQLLDENKGAKHNLPLDVVNNYFSIGVDAHIALSFHEAREAHPERFNSRLRNKMFYGQAGGKDLLQRKWKDLCNYVHLECDGKDYTGRLKELKVHSVLFLNIPSYGGGTRPWPTSSAPSNFQTPKTDDGYIEVIGLTTYQLPLLQAGGHGTIIAQCRNANIITWRTIPMQVDGEPCRLLPSIINLELRNKANIVANTKTFEHKRQMPALEKITLKIRKLNLNDYETYHYDKEKLKEISTVLGTITIDQIMELSNVRIRINEMMKEKGLRRPSSDLTAVAAAAVGNVTPITAMSTGQSSQLPTCFENESSPNETASTTNATSTTTATLTNNHSLSSCVKFVSNDWCFVDSVTAERFFRIDRAQEELYYVVDICHEDLFILDPQFDEKDDLDLFTSEEVIAKVVAGVTSTSSPLKSSSTTTTTTAVSPMRPPPSSLIMANGDDQQQISSLPIDHFIENFDNNHHYSRQNSQTLDLIPPTTLQTPPKSPLSDDNHNNNNDYLDNEPYYKQMRKLDKFNTDNLDTKISPCKQNGNTLSSTSMLLSLSPTINQQSSPAIIDSPPKSPRRRNRPSILSSSTTSPSKSPQTINRRPLLNQLMLAARNGDITLLKHLHHKGVNLMLIDEKGMSALHYAVLNNQDEAVSFLSNAFTQQMIDLCEPEFGHTALHKAIINNKNNICLSLILRGARLDIPDNNGQNCEQLGYNLGHHDLIKTLLHVSQACNRETSV
uniref:Diacylglycerol kinase n=2 Tax=Dermatophagoides pteronyssinus TaxID=6956 RepID=A0A6P6XLU7_DERPT|nr:eye-specific diacylglycerol kinase-like isoform X1 [Dermatophagoides pteronyssinus]